MSWFKVQIFIVVDIGMIWYNCVKYNLIALNCKLCGKSECTLALSAFQHEAPPEREIVWTIYYNNFIFHEFIIQSVVSGEEFSVAYGEC